MNCQACQRPGTSQVNSDPAFSSTSFLSCRSPRTSAGTFENTGGRAVGRGLVVVGRSRETNRPRVEIRGRHKKQVPVIHRVMAHRQSKERRGRDSNPRSRLPETRHFQCRTIGHSVTSPVADRFLHSLAGGSMAARAVGGQAPANPVGDLPVARLRWRRPRETDNE